MSRDNYYLRLTADLYPELIKRTEAVLGRLIPEGGYYEKVNFTKNSSN